MLGKCWGSGDGLGNKFLSHIRETNLIIHIIRSFNDMSISHVEGSINPIRDKEIIDMELQLKDLETIEIHPSRTQHTILRCTALSKCACSPLLPYHGKSF